MRILIVLLIVVCVPVDHVLAQKTITSPDKNIQVTITGGQNLLISAQYKGTAILQPSEIGMSIRGLVNNWTPGKSEMVTKDEKIYPPVTEKRKEIRDHYNQITIDFKTKFALQIRVYDDGFAYRFTTALRDSVFVEKETATYAIPPDTKFYGSAVSKREDLDEYHTSFEEPYLIKPTDSIPQDRLFFSPVLISYSNKIKAVITESDLEDYPGMFLRFENKKLTGVNAPYPKTVRVNPGEFSGRSCYES